MPGLGRAEPFSRDFSGCFCTTSCHPVLCTSAPSWEVAARSNLSGKWLFLEFHRREELSGAWNGIGASCGETGARKRHKSPRRWEPRRGTALGEREAKAQIQVRYQGKDLPSCRQAGNRHRGREGRARALQTDVCLCKRPRAAGEGTGSAAPAAPAPLLGDWDAQNSPASAFAHPCACPAVNTRFGSGTKASNTYCFCCVLSSISRLVEHCKTASGYEKDYTNEAVVRL